MNLPGDGGAEERGYTPSLSSRETVVYVGPKGEARHLAWPVNWQSEDKMGS